MSHAGLMSLLPAVVTIAVAMATHRVPLALLLGVASGAFAAAGFQGEAGLVTLWDALQGAFTDPERVRIALFILGVGGLLEMLSASGAYTAFARWVERWLHTPRRARVATWGLSLSVFFDDYANVLLVGASMRGVLRRHRLSPALLAWIVDQVATVVSLMLVSTWAAFEGSLLATSAAAVGVHRSATALLVGSLPYHASTWMGLGLAGVVAFHGRWFGRYQDRGQEAPVSLDPTPSAPPTSARLGHVLLPLGVLVCGSLGGLAVFSLGKVLHGPSQPGVPRVGSLMDLLDGAPTVWILMGATAVATAVASVQLHRDRVLDLKRQRAPFTRGLREMVPAALVILLSKGLADVSEMLGTGRTLTGLAGPLLETAPWALPVTVFAVAVILTVATGFSWSSMAILLPVAFQMAGATPAGTEALIPVLSGAVIAGSITGGLMVPYSDTTVMTAAAFGITPVYHARTQALQALPVAVASGGVLALVGLGWSWPLAYLVCGALLLGLHLALARDGSLGEEGGRVPGPTA